VPLSFAFYFLNNMQSRNLIFIKSILNKIEFKIPNFNFYFYFLNDI
jgi:hypothetical protein